MCIRDRRITGRYIAETITDPDTGEVVVKANHMVTPKRAAAVMKVLNKTGRKSVKIRTVLSCKSHIGVCAKCYGANMATGQPVQVGEAVGIIAAQSIGEPGTQLTMRTFHTGGVAGGDITQGLPRVEELFEARKQMCIRDRRSTSATVFDPSLFLFLVVFLFVFPESCEESFFLGRGGDCTAAHTLDLGDIDSAHHHFGLGLHREGLEYTLVCDQCHHLGADLGFHDRNLGPTHVLGRLVNHHLGESGLRNLHLLFVDHQNRYGLGGCVDHGLLFHLALLKLIAQEVENGQYDDCLLYTSRCV